jgi:hypothetical protein
MWKKKKKNEKSHLKKITTPINTITEPADPDAVPLAEEDAAAPLPPSVLTGFPATTPLL